MTVEELYDIFLRHIHSGQIPDARKLVQLDSTTIIVDNDKNFIILKSLNGSKFRLGVDDDGAIKTTKI